MLTKTKGAAGWINRGLLSYPAVLVAGGSEAGAMETSKQHKILVVEDVAPMRNFLKAVLEQTFENIFVSTASNGNEAIRTLLQDEFDLVICDWEMPGMDGITLVKLVRNEPEWKGLHIIMVTAKSKKQDVLQAINMGISDYIIKPVTITGLAAKVRAKLPGLVEKKMDDASPSQG